MDTKNLPVAAQLYIFSKLPDRDERMPEILRELADAGYDAVEGMYGQEPKTPEMVKDAGLRYLAPHLALAQIVEPSARREVVAFAQSMGAPFLCVSGLRVWDERRAGDYRAAVPLLNEIGAECAATGIRLLYHNHDFEFFPLGGPERGAGGMDILLNGIDPAAVGLCVDAGWIWKAAGNAPSFLRRHRERIEIIHLRDFRDSASLPLGRGHVPLNPILDEIGLMPNLAALVIEQDPASDDPVADMRESREWLKSRL